jgi:hypothetical protein
MEDRDALDRDEAAALQRDRLRAVPAVAVHVDDARADDRDPLEVVPGEERVGEAIVSTSEPVRKRGVSRGSKSPSSGLARSVAPGPGSSVRRLYSWSVELSHAPAGIWTMPPPR